MTSRIGNASNQYQGSSHRVLCVCKGGLLRSPTIALILSLPPYNYNTRSCGTKEYALIPLNTILLSWADEIVTVEASLMTTIEGMLQATLNKSVPIHNLNIPDVYAYRDPELVELIKERYNLVAGT